MHMPVLGGRDEEDVGEVLEDGHLREAVQEGLACLGEGEVGGGVRVSLAELEFVRVGCGCGGEGEELLSVPVFSSSVQCNRFGVLERELGEALRAAPAAEAPHAQLDERVRAIQHAWVRLG